MKTILMTGFEPFDGEAVNPALEAVKLVDGYKTGEYIVRAKPLPVVRGKSLTVLQSYLKELEPAYVVAIGQAAGRMAVNVERVGINVDDFRIPDNEGNQPLGEPIVSDGPVAYWATLPVKQIVADMHNKGIPAVVSNTAGTYVCNHVLYGLLHHLATEETTCKGAGFVHIPYLPEQGVKNVGQPTMAVETIVKALQSLADTLAEA